MNDLLRIINHYGVKHQLRKLHEEVYELTEAIISEEQRKITWEKLKIQAPFKINLKKHITEELADVMCLLIQFIYFYDMNIDDVFDEINFKAKRQLKRIEEEGK